MALPAEVRSRPRSSHRIAIALFALLALTLATQAAPDAHADPVLPTAPTGPVPLAVIIRGSGSLGAFEAGALYYLAALAQRNPGLVDPRLVTGTSAGSINAVLSVVEGCGALPANPSESLFFKTWVTIARTGLADGASLNWRTTPDLDDTTLPAGMAFMAIDPTAMTWLPGTALEKTQATSSHELLGSLVPGVLESALTAEFQQVLGETPDVGQRLGVLQGDWPLISGGLGSLMGFMERDFRTFDFYLGMVEARRLAEQLILPWTAPLGRGVLPEPGPDKSPTLRESWRPFRCAQAVLRGADAALVATECSGLDSQFLASRHRSTAPPPSAARSPADAVAKLPEAPDFDARAHCRSVCAGTPVRRVPGVPNAGKGQLVDTADARDEASHDETLRLLVLHHFAFRDLGLGRASLHAIKTHISALVHDMLRALADQQVVDETIWRIAGRTLSQALSYRPPAHAFHLVAGGTWELGWSMTDNDAPWSWLRFGLGAQFDGVPSALDAEVQTYFALTLGAGIELEPTGLSGVLAQLRFGLRGGSRVTSGDHFWGSTHTPGTPRSRPAAGLYTSLTLIQWLRVQLGVSWYPQFEGHAATWSVRPLLGIELDLPL